MRPTKRSRITMSHKQSCGQSYMKRSSKQSSSHAMNIITIDDLPDLVILNILLRLPLKYVTRCKCVSKHWSALISSQYFLSRFLSVQKRHPSTLIFWDTEFQMKFFSLSKHSKFKARRLFSLNFLPCYQSAAHKKRVIFRPVVVGACNDLVLCCATTCIQRDYYICNPCTKQWVAVPPVPRCRASIRVGFICEPYYDHNLREVENNSSSIIQFNVNYRYAIVRILDPLLSLDDVVAPSHKLVAQVFSSEAGQWTEIEVMSLKSYSYDHLLENPGLVYKGKVYWSSESEGYMIGLDPFFNHNTTSTSNSTNDPRQFTHVIDFPNGKPGVISVSRRGHLRMHRLSSDEAHFPDAYIVNVWEMKDEVDGTQDGKWCLISTFPVCGKFGFEWSPNTRDRARVLASDPNDDDILYLDLYNKYAGYNRIIKCNIRTKNLKVANTKINHRRTSREKKNIYDSIGVIPFTVPCLPTPVPIIKCDNHREMHAAHFSNCFSCSSRRFHKQIYE